MTSAVAHAADYRLLVMIDASGSMVAPTPEGTRFDSAKAAALEDIASLSDVMGPSDTMRVAVYTFTCASLPCAAGENPLVLHTGSVEDPFTNRNGAIVAVNALSVANNVGGWTPLAAAMCGAVDKLVAFPLSTKILSLSSDGEENATPGGPCQGDLYTGDPPYPGTSWQARSINYFTGKNVTPWISLFQLDFSLRGHAVAGAKEVATSEGHVRANAPSLSSGLTPLETFFSILVAANGGRLSVVNDDQPLPVSGDLNNDRCTDRADAVLLARHFGPVVPPMDGKFDLNGDRVVDFTDYAAQRSRINPNCGPDPFVPRAPIVCSGPGQIVIDGQAVEDGAISISVRSACQIVIRNSLIVAGQSGISIDGSAVVRLDNSIVVGGNAITGTRGTIILSAANTVFHGPLVTKGAFSYIDRGGNVFE